MNRIVVILLFIAVVLGCGFLIGANNLPGEWYQSLAKPWFTPPNWLFAPAWTVLYVIVGFVGGRLFLDHRRSPAMRWWVAQMIFNFAWSPLFFGMQEIAMALIVMLSLLISIVGFMATAMRQDRLSALLFVPYLVWVGLATALNTSILLAN